MGAPDIDALPPAWLRYHDFAAILFRQSIAECAALLLPPPRRSSNWQTPSLFGFEPYRPPIFLPATMTREFLSTDTSVIVREHPRESGPPWVKETVQRPSQSLRGRCRFKRTAPTIIHPAKACDKSERIDQLAALRLTPRRSAIVVSFLSAASSSFRVAESLPTTSSCPSCCAQAISVPYRVIS